MGTTRPIIRSPATCRVCFHHGAQPMPTHYISLYTSFAHSTCTILGKTTARRRKQNCSFCRCSCTMRRFVEVVYLLFANLNLHISNIYIYMTTGVIFVQPTLPPSVTKHVALFAGWLSGWPSVKVWPLKPVHQPFIQTCYFHPPWLSRKFSSSTSCTSFESARVVTAKPPWQSSG